MKYRKIIGGTKEEAEKKFPWLKEADFEDAVIDIREVLIIWKNGIWKDGVWEIGIWEDGTWENGIWEDGIWESGTWKNGFWEDGIRKDGTWETERIWNNSLQKYQKVTFITSSDFYYKIKNLKSNM